MKKITFEYYISEENVFDFLTAIKPYASNLCVSRLIDRYNNNSKLSKSYQIRKEILINEILNVLTDGKKSTPVIFKYLRSKSVSVSEKQLYRTLIALSASNQIEIQKVPKENGGFQNMYSIVINKK